EPGRTRLVAEYAGIDAEPTEDPRPFSRAIEHCPGGQRAEGGGELGSRAVGQLAVTAEQAVEAQGWSERDRQLQLLAISQIEGSLELAPRASIDGDAAAT